MLVVDRRHECGSRRQQLVDEDEDGLVRGQLDALPDDVDKLADSEVRGHQVLLLVDGGDVALLNLLANDLQRDEAKSVFITSCGSLMIVTVVMVVMGATARSRSCSGVKIARGSVDVSDRMPAAGRRTGMRSRYLERMRSASALRFSKGCSSLNLERIVEVEVGILLVVDGCSVGCSFMAVR